jgi:hypothetical protein
MIIALQTFLILDLPIAYVEVKTVEKKFPRMIGKKKNYKRNTKDILYHGFKRK